MAYRHLSRGIAATHPVTGAVVARWANSPVASLAGSKRILNVPRDLFDLRDRQYQPTLVPLPDAVDHRGRTRPRQLRNQGGEGSCTGFAMAAVVNHLMAARGRKFDASPRFLYENARRYDEWKGAEYEGSSIRGAMKGFLKHGVCPWDALPYVDGRAMDRIPAAALAAALDRPLGAYYRVSTSSINDMQSALHEVGVVLASAQVHRGWDAPVAAKRGLARIAWKPGHEQQGGHAFALVGYDAEGFIVQNSWGTGWGSGGFARLDYDDWLVNRMDAWVCQLGVGHVQRKVLSTGPGSAAAGERKVEDAEIRGHYLAVRNGTFDGSAPFQSGEADLADLAKRVAEFARKRHAATGKPGSVMLFAHGGLVGEHGAAARTLSLIRRFVPAGSYPISFIWHTGLAETLGDLILGQQRRVAPAAGEERVEGWLKDKVIEAKDEALEWALGGVGGPIWREMKGDAVEACHGPGVSERDADGGHAPGRGPAFALLDAIHAAAAQGGVPLRWHLVGHSAGTIFHCRLFDWFVRNGVRLGSVSFIAPAVSCALFRRTIMANDALVGRFGLHTMPDADERDDDCMKIYSKSLLYLVSESFERDDDRQLLGLDRNIRMDHRQSTRRVDPLVAAWLGTARVELDFHRPDRTDPTLHGSFDDDPRTMDVVERRVR